MRVWPSKRLVITLGQAGVSVSLIAVIISRIDYSHFLAHWRNLGFAVVVALLALLAGQVVMAGARLKFVLAALGARLPLRRTSAIGLCGSFFEQVAFGFVGGDVMRLWLLQRSDVPLRSAFCAVLVDRCFGVASIVLLVLCGLRGLMAVVGEADQQIVVAVLIVLVAGAGVGALGLAMLPRRWQHFPIVGDLSRLLVTVREHGSARVSLLAALCIAGATHLSNLVIIAVIGHALGMPVNPAQWFSIVPAVLLFSMLPISAGGWGVREAAMVVALQRLGVAPDAAVVPSIVFGLGILIITLPGGVVWMMNGRGTATRSPKLKLSAEAGL